MGQNIKKYREKKFWTQSYLSEKLDISCEYLCRVERGQKYMSLKKLFELADILEVDFNKLTDFV
ncbi:helix-turn-helix transcriptional regulator [bacterium]|nr:helix-turn-helix transcriptional regulator [bacterium]